MKFLEVNNLTFRYPGREQDALHDVSFSLEEGEFMLLLGRSGSGKSTLLRLLKRELSRNMKYSGTITFSGKDRRELTDLEAACDIGLVRQNPDSQIVCDSVLSELCFGLENLNYPPDEMRKRVAEMAGFFGIGGWMHKKTHALSGGQKQLLNLASVMVLQPKLLLLDEPTAQLDPISSGEFMQMLYRINRELSVTVIVCEQNTDKCFALGDKAVILERGEVLLTGGPREIGETISEDQAHACFGFLPTPVRIYSLSGRGGACPVSVSEGKRWFDSLGVSTKPPVNLTENSRKEIEAISCKEVYFSYDKGADILRDLTMSARYEEVLAVLGQNGSGKSTLLSMLAGLIKPERGKVRLFDKGGSKSKGKQNIMYLPQKVQSMFIEDTLIADLNAAAQSLGLEDPDGDIARLAEFFGMTDKLKYHPFDLSGGELQRAALIKALLKKPEILLLDEPDKGLDFEAKERLGRYLLKLKEDGLAVILVTHDVDFAAAYADRCMLLFDGQNTLTAAPADFFGGNYFYTTDANKIVRGANRRAITCEDAVKLCKS